LTSRILTFELARTLFVPAFLLAILVGSPSRSADLPPSTPAPAQPAATTAPAAQPAPVAADPYGFTSWLNSTRAQYGLPPVGFDPNLSNWANVNNGEQQARGMGHHVMGPARRQNSGMGDCSTVSVMWMASPAHRSALLDPSIRWIGIAGLGAYWTFNAY
jgi:uncharacterized protein YkwD